MNNKRTKGVSGFTLLLFAVVLFAVLWYTSRFEERDRQLSWEEFQTLVTSDEVAGVTVRQNRSVPTGLRARMKKGILSNIFMYRM